MAMTEPRPESLLPLQPAVFHILMALADEDRHGYAIIQEVLARTNGEVRLSPGTLYRSIQRMLDDDLIVEVHERPAPELDDERRRYYRITRFGKAVAREEANRLTRSGAAGARQRLRHKEGVTCVSTARCCTSFRDRSAPSTAREMTKDFAREWKPRAAARPAC